MRINIEIEKDGIRYGVTKEIGEGFADWVLRSATTQQLKMSP